MVEIGKFFLRLFLTILKLVAAGIAHVVFGAINPSAGQGAAYAVIKWFRDTFGDLVWE